MNHFFCTSGTAIARGLITCNCAGNTDWRFTMTAIHRVALPAWLCVLAVLLAGCMAERNAQVPSEATVSAEGSGHVSYRAPQDGKVYVFDRNQNRVVYAGDIQKDQLVLVDPDADHITVGNSVVSEKGLHKGDTHRIFFEPYTAQTARHTVIEERTTESTVH